MTLIEFNGVSFTYEGSTSKALRDISLEIGEGEFIGVVGGTGEGKTTFVRCINGLIPNLIKGEFKGSVVVNGLDTRDVPVSKMASEVGFVFQDPDEQIFALEVYDEIAFGPENFGFSKAEVENLVESAAKLVGINDLLDKETNELSRGQRQLVCMASVLALDPKILVLDEPTASLDFKNTTQVYNVLKKLNKKGKTIVTVEHKTNFLARYASRILVINGGRVITNSTSRNVFENVELLNRVGVEVPLMYLLSWKLAGRGTIRASELEETLNKMWCDR